MRRNLGPIYKGGVSLQEELRQTTLPEGSVAFWHLGQAGVAIKGAGSGGIIYIDPYLTFSIEDGSPESEFRRGFPPPIEPGEIVDAEVVLVTHHHDDHLDLKTLTAVSQVSEKTAFVVPSPSLSVLSKAGIETDRIIAARDGDHIGLMHGAVLVQPVAVAHTEYEVDEQQDHLYLGYCITVDQTRLFHAGDCVVDDRLIERVRALEPDVVFLPINGLDHARTARGIVGNMSYRDAADFALAVHADLVVPIHYDLFANNRENPAYFVDYLFHTYPAQKFHLPVPGERFVYVK